MYICPTCGQEYETEDKIVKHFLSCWKEKNPNYKSNKAPHSEDIIERKINDSILAFFESRL